MCGISRETLRNILIKCKEGTFQDKFSYLSWALVFSNIGQYLNFIFFLRWRCWTDVDICCFSELRCMWMLKWLVLRSLGLTALFCAELMGLWGDAPNNGIKNEETLKGEQWALTANGILFDECVETSRVKPVAKWQTNFGSNPLPQSD